MLDSVQKWKTRRVHRHNGGDRQYQKVSLWDGPSIVLKVIWQAMWASKLGSHDLSTKIIVRGLPWLSEKGRIGFEKFPPE